MRNQNPENTNAPQVTVTRRLDQLTFAAKDAGALLREAADLLTALQNAPKHDSMYTDKVLHKKAMEWAAGDYETALSRYVGAKSDLHAALKAERDEMLSR